MSRLPKKNKVDDVKRKLFQYSPHKVTQALNAIRKGMPVATASRDFNVPRTTLRHKLSGKAPETSGHVGPQAVLGSDIEREIVLWIKDCARAGFPINKEGLLDSVKKVVIKGQLKTPFINNRPSRSWFDGFMTRHPDLSQKHAEYINKARALITEEKIRNWFKEVSSLLGEENLKILEDPLRVWNCDETAFFLAPKGSLVLAEKGQHVYDTSKNSDKDNITTLFTVNAAGQYAPPLTVYKYKRMSSDVIDNAPDGWGVGKTDKGWMTGESFYEYIANVFIPYLKEKGIQLPIILFLDGHKSHLTMQLSELCRENGIIVVALVPNTTHMLQPLDVAVFYPLKQNWRQLVKKWRIENDGQEITKFNLPSALESLLLGNKESFERNVRAGFQTCGLYPFGADFVNFKRIVKNTNIKASNDNYSRLTISESSYISYLESKIDPHLLKDFYTTFESGKDWDGNNEASMLYDTWLAFKNDNTATISRAHITSRDTNNAVRETHSPSLLDQSAIDSVSNAQIENDSRKATFFESSTLHEEEQESVPSTYRTSAEVTPHDHQKDILHENSSSNISNEDVHTDENKCSNLPVVTRTVRDLVKDCLLYPGKVVPKNTRKATYVPSVITSNQWRDIMKAAEKEKLEKKTVKKKKEKETDKKKKGKQLKQQNKKVSRARVISSSEEDGEVNYIESGESEWNEFNDSNDENMKEKENKMHNKRKRSQIDDSSSESELPLNQLTNSSNKECKQNMKPGSFVIIKYEGEYFPGRIENKDGGFYEISTMVLSTNNTFRWPEKPDKIWYTINDIVETINPPIKHNNRGFFKVIEMEKFLPNIYT